MSKLSKGDDVSWNTPQGKTSGKVVKKVKGTQSVTVGNNKKRTVKASDEDKVIVKSKKSGKQAVHSAKSLKKET